MKKMLCLVLSVVIAFGALSILAFAADAPEVSLKVDKQTVRKGETVTVTVNVPKDSKICVTTIDFIYDTACYTLDEAKANGLISGEQFNDNYEGKKIVRYTASVIDGITTGGELFTVELKVKKPDGKLKLDIKEVYVDENGEAKDVTVRVKAKSTLEAVLTCRHDFQETIIKPATCIKDGEKAQECKICGFTKDSAVIEAKGHTLNTVTVEPTCDKAGKQYDECTVCNWKSAEKVLKAKGHDTQTVVIDSTCANEGKKYEECKVCGWKSEPQAIKTKPHDTETITVPATCDTDGETYLQCKECGWKSESVVLKAGHKAGDWEVVIEATETEKGMKVKKCTVCGAVVEEAEIPVKEPGAVKGDVNGDGELSAVDARMILRHVARVETLTLSQMANADVNGDLKITAVDARRILRIVAGLEKA
ncbi:MAG: hypothetical protein IKC45_00670 [Clostridia bacterium]|nr:hypothetical protein [Clostridia bacterium]